MAKDPWVGQEGNSGLLVPYYSKLGRFDGIVKSGTMQRTYDIRDYLDVTDPNN